MGKINNSTCLICSFIPLDNFYTELWNKLYIKLKEKKIDLVLLSGHDKDLMMPVIEIPFSLKGFYEKFESIYNESYELSEKDIYLIERDIFWNSDSVENYEKYIKGLFACKSFYTAVIEKIKPSFVFVWGYLLPQSIIFKNLLDEKNIPSFFLERGFFSGSFMIEDILYAELKSNSKNLNNYKQNNSFDKYYKLKEFYNNYSNTKYPENQDLHLQNFLKEKKQNGFKIITFYGMHDVAIFPEDFILSKNLSGIFNYTTDAVAFLSETVNKFDNVILVIKPHPNDSFRYDDITGDNIYVTKKFINKNLIQLSDVIIVTNSTIQYEAIFSEKPIITIGNSPIIDFNATYTPKTKEELYSSIYQALERKDLSEKLYNSKIFVECVLESHTYFYDTNNFGKDLNQFVDFIDKNTIKYNDSNTLTQRLMDFEERFLLNKIIRSSLNSNDKFVHIDTLDQLINIRIDSLKFKLGSKISKYNTTLISFYNDYIKKAENLIQINSLIEAESLLKKVLNYNITKNDALNDLSYIEILRLNYQAALDYITKVLEINPNDEIAINNLNYLIENNLLSKDVVKNKLKILFNKPLNIIKIFNIEEFQNYIKRNAEILKSRLEFELNLIPENQHNFFVNGYCYVCDDLVPLSVDFIHSHLIPQKNEKLIPYWRERLVCPTCGLNNRMRLTYHLIKELFPNFQSLSVYITEQITPFFKILKKLNPEIIGSEFFENSVPLGFVNDEGIRNEDFTKLTFDKEKFDLVISLEVLEHIPNYLNAISESFRVLKNGGKFLFTVPFDRNSAKNVIRAKVDDNGKIIHILPPEYHGNPLSQDGSLCFTNFGWEILGQLKNAGYSNAYALFVYSREYGYLGEDQIVFIAEKTDKIVQSNITINQNYHSANILNSLNNNIEVGDNNMIVDLKNELLVKAEELIEKGNLLDAKKILDTMLIFNSQDTDALNDLAVVEILDENYSLAFEYLKKVLSINPENVVAIDNMKYIKDKLLEINASKSEKYEPKYEKINCPFCGSDKSEQYRISADIVKCKNCQTVYLRTRLTQDEMRKLYQSYADEGSHMALPKNKQEILNSPLRRDYLLSEILEYIQPDGILLDIGCGWGAFLDNARSKGFEPRGIELTKKCVRFANEELRINVTDKFFEDVYFENESISVVTMIHVLEHIPTPITTLKKIFQILKPNGLFAGIVPNIESYCSQTLKEQWYWLDPNYHYVHYSSKILKKHLENYGFEILKLYTTTGDYGKENLINIIMNVEKISRETSIQRLAQIEKSYMGEEIRFIAKKKL